MFYATPGFIKIALRLVVSLGSTNALATLNFELSAWVAKYAKNSLLPLMKNT